MRAAIAIPATIIVAAIAFARPAHADSKLLADLQGRFDASPDKAKAKLGCKGDWTTDTSGPATTLTCAASSQTQVVVSGGAVVAMGMPLVDRGTDRAATDAFKAGTAELAAAKCKSLAARGQMTVQQCPGRFAVILLLNWNSKDNTNTTTAMFGPADQMLALVGIKPAP